MAAGLLAASSLLTSCATVQGLLSAPAAVEVQPARVLTHEERLRADVTAAATAYLGAPYSYGAKGPSRFDCSGFTSHVLADFDISLLGSSRSQAKQGRSIPADQAQPGDIVYFVTESGRVHHVALVVANGAEGLEVVHATTSRGVVRDNITRSSYWAPRLAGARCVVDCRADMASAF